MRQQLAYLQPAATATLAHLIVSQNVATGKECLLIETLYSEQVTFLNSVVMPDAADSSSDEEEEEEDDEDGSDEEAAEAAE